MIELVLPITLALFLYSLGRNDQRDPRGWRKRALFLSTLQGHAAFFYAALALLLILGVIFTRSRTCIALTIVGVLAVTFAFGRGIGGDNAVRTGRGYRHIRGGDRNCCRADPGARSFAFADLTGDGRWIVFAATMDGVLDFFHSAAVRAPIRMSSMPFNLSSWVMSSSTMRTTITWNGCSNGGVFVALLTVLLLGLYML